MKKTHNNHGTSLRRWYEAPHQAKKQKEIDTKRLILILFLICSANSYAANLQSSDAQLIKAAFVFGNKDLGFRFVTSTPREDVHRCYRNAWSPRQMQKSIFGKKPINGFERARVFRRRSKSNLSNRARYATQD